MFTALAAGGDRFTDADPAAQPHPAIAPADTVVVKKRVGSFVGSDLELILRSRAITDLVLAGISTSGMVLSTVRDAADRDYRITVLADACAEAERRRLSDVAGQGVPAAGRRDDG